ncbi:hypothetical protein V6N13_113356 [Hibiscus sabdariffa]
MNAEIQIRKEDFDQTIEGVFRCRKIPPTKPCSTSHGGYETSLLGLVNIVFPKQHFPLEIEDWNQTDGGDGWFYKTETEAEQR